jgi:hypothetical protein
VNAVGRYEFFRYLAQISLSLTPDSARGEVSDVAISEKRVLEFKALFSGRGASIRAARAKKSEIIVRTAAVSENPPHRILIDALESTAARGSAAA